MRTTFKKRKNAAVLSIFTFLMICVFTFSNNLTVLVKAHNSIPYSIDWTNTNLIVTDNTWSVSAELGVRGYAGADTPVVPGADARTVLAESLILDVDANETDPNTLVEGGVAEFEIANPTIALKGSDTAHSPYINLLMDSRGLQNIRLRCNVRDIDSTANNAVQQVAVQFRTRDDETGPYTDVPSAYIADATQGGTATLVTPIDVILPPEAEGRVSLEIRVMTVNAVGEDEWIGIDDIRVTAEGPTPTPSPEISGRVTYANASVVTPVPSTVLSAVGSTSFSTLSNANGFYSLRDFSVGAYVVTPSKTGQINGISNLDASRVAQHIVGLTVLNSTQIIAADTSGNGTVGSLDAAYIAQFVASIPNPGLTGRWKFLPSSRSYSNVQTSQGGQDFSAILVGDVTGNWNPNIGLQREPSSSIEADAAPAATGIKQSPQTDIYEKSTEPIEVAAVTINDNEDIKSSGLTVELRANDTTGAGILGYQFEVHYDPRLMAPRLEACDAAETLSAQMTAVCRESEPGVLNVVAFGTETLSGAGSLLKLKFNRVGARGQPDMKITNFMFNENAPQEVAIGALW